MKKLTAMLLVLCMLLAIVPTLGETASGLSGNWYMTLADVTLGYILLNEDGTAVINIAAESDVTGTWTADGDSVTITVDGEPVAFAYDGTSLKNDLFPLEFIRDEGRLPADVITKMTAGEAYELPEGMTETDAMMLLMNFMTEYTKLMEDYNNTTASADETAASANEPATPAAKPEVTVLKENFKVVSGYSGYEGIYYAKVQNGNDFPVFLDDGSLTVKDAEGTVIGEADYFYPSASKYLEPGEISFVGMRADLNKIVDDAAELTWEKTITATKDSYHNTDHTVQTADPVYIKSKSEYDRDSMKVTVINDTDQLMPGIEAVLVLEDAEGNLLDIQTVSLYRYELGPNSTLNISVSVDSDVTEYCQANGIKPAAVEAFAWAENDD